jgi:hypothetical protein
MNKSNNSLDQANLEIEAAVNKATATKNKIINDLHKEIQKREETIILSRKDYLALKNSMKEEIEVVKKKCQNEINELEITYEKKFSHESLYLEKMKQAYDEYAVNTRLDLNELNEETKQKLESMELQKNIALSEAEYQKTTMLKYFEFISLRHKEILQALEDKQVEER